MLFALGTITVTPAASAVMYRQDILLCSLLDRHKCGDWGEVSEETRLKNNAAVHGDLRLHSAYEVSEEVIVWVITEKALIGDRRTTTVLLPEEYWEYRSPVM